MTQLNWLVTRCLVELTLPRKRDDRGDVPGWVMVTVMTAGIVAVIGVIAQDQFAAMLRAALAKVK